MPEISVIIPVYKAERTIGRCIDSLLMQDYKDFEILLIDDGSPDRSGQICEEYAKKDKRIKVFHQENRGVSSARNVGIDNARGHWISFVDSDDWVSSNYFKFIEECNDSDLVYFSLTICYTDGSKTSYQLPEKIVQGEGNIKRLMYKLKENEQQWCHLGYTWNKFFKTEIIKNNNLRFTSNLSLHEDELFTLQYFKYVERVLLLPVSLYNYQLLSTGLTRKKRNNASEFLLLAEKYKENIQWMCGSDVFGLYLGEILNLYIMSFYFEKSFSQKIRIARKISFWASSFCKEIRTHTRFEKFQLMIVRRFGIIGLFALRRVYLLN